MTKTIVSVGRQTKPAKPRKDFPLFAHNSGSWAKKVRGKVHYFGPWSDPLGAEKKWERDKLALLEGRNPEDSNRRDDVGWLCNVWMDSNKAKHDRDEMTKRSLDDYHKIAKHVAAFFGKGRSLDSIRATDFERYRASLPEHWSPTTTNNHLRRARVLFEYGNQIEATDRPLAYKHGLKCVPKKVVRSTNRSNRPRSSPERRRYRSSMARTVRRRL